MKLYILGRKYLGTQADAKAAAKTTGGQFQLVDVPTDKDGLMAYLNRLMENGAAPGPTVQERMNALSAEAKGESYTDRSVAIDDVFEALPLARKLHFAALAMEEARDAVGRDDGIDFCGIVETPEDDLGEFADDETDPFS